MSVNFRADEVVNVANLIIDILHTDLFVIEFLKLTKIIRSVYSDSLQSNPCKKSNFPLIRYYDWDTEWYNISFIYLLTNLSSFHRIPAGITQWLLWLSVTIPTITFAIWVVLEQNFFVEILIIFKLDKKLFCMYIGFAFEVLNIAFIFISIVV